MNAPRKLIFFLSLLLLTAGLTVLLAGPAVEQYARVLADGRGTQDYEAVAVGADGLAAAAGWSDEGVVLRFFTTDGAAAGKWTAELPAEELGGTIAALYPCRTDLALLAVYGPDAETLTLYRVDADGGAERLLQETCRGTSSAARRDGTRLSVFSQSGDRVTFALLSGGEITAYACAADQGGLEEMGSGSGAGASSAAVLTDGTLAVGGQGSLTLDGRANPGVTGGQLVTHLTRTGVGLYFVDGADLSVYYSDLTGSSVRQVLELEEAVAGRQLSGLALTADGSALLLLDGSSLQLVGEHGAVELRGVLYPSAARSAAMLAVFAAVALAMAWLLWYAACGGRRRGGCLLAALALAGSLTLQYAIARPSAAQAEAESRAMAVDGVLQLALTENDLADEALPASLAAALERVHGSNFRSVSVTAAQRVDGRWYQADGSRAELAADFDAALAEAAGDGLVWEQTGGRFRCCVRSGDWAITVAAAAGDGARGGLATAAVACIVLMTAVAVLVLLGLGRSVRRLSAAAGTLTDGGAVPRLRTGDELAGLAGALRSTAEALGRQQQAREELVRSYRRFVPEQLLTLLGKRSIQEVDKQTFASRRMAVMTVWFRFPDPVYTHADNNRLLFDSVNQVIEATASLATRGGGTVFHFAYDGYDVVMDLDGGRAISTAVAIQQEVLAFNEARARDGLPTVRFRIALDVGDMMIGVVGDSMRLEPTTISTSFTTVRTLVSLSNRLEAHILCTEAMIAGAGQYGSRYLGKCRLDSGDIRVYEIFDGDEYGVRKGKATTVQRFTQGVYALYSGETARAKRTFLELVHDHPADGAARYYLYLADRMEREPDLPCGLNLPGADGREG